MEYFNTPRLPPWSGAGIRICYGCDEDPSAPCVRASPALPQTPATARGWVGYPTRPTRPGCMAA